MMISNNIGHIQQGGEVHIRFPNMDLKLSVGNETELATAIEMLRKALELHEVEKAKTLLVQDMQNEKLYNTLKDPRTTANKYPSPTDITTNNIVGGTLGNV